MKIIPLEKRKRSLQDFRWFNWITRKNSGKAVDRKHGEKRVTIKVNANDILLRPETVPLTTDCSPDPPSPLPDP